MDWSKALVKRLKSTSFVLGGYSTDKVCLMKSSINGPFPSLRRLYCPVLENEWENRERMGVTVMPAKYRQGDDLLRILARAYKPICVLGSGGILRVKCRLLRPTVVG